MRIKTFILTFLMMMSSPFLFGQQQHWTDPGEIGDYDQSMSLLAQIVLDDIVQVGDYEVAAFCNDKTLAVGRIVPLNGTTSDYHVHLNVQGNTTLSGIYFKFFDGTKEYVSSTEMSFTEGIKGSHGSYETINFKTVAQIEGTDYDVVYPSLQDAIDACKEGDNTITLLTGISTTESAIVKNGLNVTLNLNGKTITGTDNTSKNFSLIDNRGNLTITGNGKMTLTATINSGWSRYSAVIANNPGGKLTIENGTFEHLGGTDMAYGIDNLTNGKDTYAETVINGGTIKSTYTGVRQFLNGVEAQNILTVNGGTIEGANRSIWMQDPSKNANTGTLTVSEYAQLKGDVYLSVTEGSTEWPVEISIAAAALKDGATVLTSNLPAGVDVQNINGIYRKVNVVAQIGETKYQTLAEAFAAAQGGDEVKILVAGTYALGTSGKDITITGAVDGVVFDNIGATNMGDANVTFNNVTFTYANNSTYKGLQHSGNLVYNDCTFNGQVFLYGTSETFNNCTFNQTTGNYNVWTYGAEEVAFNECEFYSAGKSVLIYTESATTFNTVTVTDCSFEATASVEGKAAIEMDSSLSAGINLTISNTSATNFGYGNVSHESLWNNKKGNQGANNDITVTVDGTVVLFPTTVAKIGVTEYQLLQKAVDAATATDVIYVVGSTTENIKIAENATITLTFAENVVLNGYIAPFKGNLTINGGTINNTDSAKSAIEINGGELTLNAVNISSARHGVRIDGAVTATINGGKYRGGETGGTLHALNVSGAANVTITDGTFVGPKGTNADSGSAIKVQIGSTVTIEGGNFSGGKNNTLSSDGTLTVKGGTFDQNPQAYVTTPYVVIKKSDNEYNVIKGVAKIGETYYPSLAAAIEAAQDNDEIVILRDIEVTINNDNVADLPRIDDKYATYCRVAGKQVTIDLNGHKVKGNVTTGTFLVALISTELDGKLTIVDNTDDKEGTIEINASDDSNVYSLVTSYDKTSSITIEAGNYTLNKVTGGQSLMYNSGEMKVKGGNFHLGNLGQGVGSNNSNGIPWIFNCLGQNKLSVEVTGGTFNADVNHQSWSNEVYVPGTLALRNNGNGTWTVVDAVAYVVERGTLNNAKARNIGYATLAEAVVAKATDEKVTMLEDVELEEALTIAADNVVILDLNGKTISGTCNAGQTHLFMVENTADLTIKDSSANAEGKVTFAQGTSNVGWTINLEGDLTLESGTIELTGSWNIGYAVDVRPNSWGTEYTEATTFTMKGGKVISSDGAIRVASTSADTHENVSANFVMNGGEIDAAWDGIFIQQSNAAYDILNVEVTGGKIAAAVGPIRFYGPEATSVLNNVEKPMTVNIAGGTFDYTGDAESTDTRWLVPNVVMIGGGATFDAMMAKADFEITGGTFDGDVNEYCAKGYAAVDNNDGTWTVVPAQKQSLVQGWNWYSSYLKIKSEDLLSALGTNASAVVSDNAGNAYYEESYGWDNTLAEDLDLSKMYMIETSAAFDLNLAGELADASKITITLNPGWNWIGYPSNVETRISDAFSEFTPNNGDVIKSKTNSFAEYYAGQWYDGNSEMTMEPTKGYMYFNSSDQTVTFKYNIVPVNSRGNNETAVATQYSVDYTKYPFNMTMVAVVDGAMGDNYEVAAFVNGEVRGSARPVYVEVLDAYMLFLTISGDNVEEVSFKYYDIATGEEYNLNNRINYSNNAIVGSVNEPYVFSRGTMGIGEASLSEINIYPNPTTTGREINLQTTCDKVEVFNALGVKVAEYQNVDSIDAFETAGIYVIRLTNNGDVKHCKLTIR